MTPEESKPQTRPTKYEGADLHPVTILKVGVALVLVVIVTIVGVMIFFHYLQYKYPDRTSQSTPVVSALPPEPRLQTDPLRELREVRKAEDSHLTGYRWIDRQQNIAQIPIDRAMVLWVKNDSATAANSAPAPSVTELQMRQDKAKEASHAP